MARQSRSRAYKKHGIQRNVPQAGRSWSGWFEDVKCGRIFFRSAVEHDFLVHASLDHAVARFWRNDVSLDELDRYNLARPERPNVQLPVTLADGRERDYEADLVLELKGGRLVLVECGSDEEKSAPAEMEVLSAASVAALELGYSFLIATDRTLRGTLLDNRTKLRSWLRPVSAPGALADRAREIFEASTEQLSIADVTERVVDEVAGDLPDSVIEEAVRYSVAAAHADGLLRGPLTELSLTLTTPLAIAQCQVPA